MEEPLWELLLARGGYCGYPGTGGFNVHSPHPQRLRTHLSFWRNGDAVLGGHY